MALGYNAIEFWNGKYFLLWFGGKWRAYETGADILKIPLGGLNIMEDRDKIGLKKMDAEMRVGWISGPPNLLKLYSEIVKKDLQELTNLQKQRVVEYFGIKSEQFTIVDITKCSPEFLRKVGNPEKAEKPSIDSYFSKITSEMMEKSGLIKKI